MSSMQSLRTLDAGRFETPDILTQSSERTDFPLVVIVQGVAHADVGTRRSSSASTSWPASVNCRFWVFTEASEAIGAMAG
jgi:hypothetical protein